jgi:glycosyltransferase involved in cell wall biosynthesis
VPGTRQILFPFSLRRRGLSFPLQLLWERFALPRLVKTLSIDVFLRPNLAWYQLMPCPQAVIIHDLAEYHPQGGMQYSRLRRIYRRMAAARNAKQATRVLTVSAHAAGEFRARFPEAAGRIEVVHNGPPEPHPRELGASRGDACFLTVGKLLRHKNHMTLCRAYVAADKATPLRAPLIFLGGDGNASDELRAYVQAHGYADRILFRGYVPEAEVKDHYRRALAFLFPTYYEGFGLPVLESMAQGVPVVCSNGACLPEVAGSAALLLDPGSEQDWAKALGDIAGGRMDLDGMARAGYANLKRFSWDASAAKLAGILEALARKGGGPAAPGSAHADAYAEKENG